MSKSDVPGVVLHRGLSDYDGTPIVVIASFGKSSNRKTGSMIQVYILADNGKPPHVNVKEDKDEGICFGCPLKGTAWKERGCYVNVANGPYTVWECYMRGGYAEYDPAEHDQYFADREVRWGAYGEPVLIPIAIVKRVCRIAKGWTGYTHQWRQRKYQKYRRFYMASTHTVDECVRAVAKGWRFFKSANKHSEEDIALLRAITPGFNCPASKEAGKRLTCRECLACNGNARPVGNPQAASVWIDTHGGLGVMHASKHLTVLN